MGVWGSSPLFFTLLAIRIQMSIDDLDVSHGLIKILTSDIIQQKLKIAFLAWMNELLFYIMAFRG